MTTKKMLWSVVIACSIGCTGSGEGADGQPLSGQDPNGQPTQQEGCAQLCSPYDPSQCETFCPPEPPDAAIPEDPYHGGGPGPGSPVDGSVPPDPQGSPVDGSVPSDPYALGGETHQAGAGHRSC